MALHKSLWQQLIEIVPKPFRNRYVLVLALFVFWMLAFDSANFLTQWKLSKSVENLEKDKIYYQEKIKEAQREKEEVEGNKEKYAREKYYMHRKNEDVYIFVDEDEE